MHRARLIVDALTRAAGIHSVYLHKAGATADQVRVATQGCGNRYQVCVSTRGQSYTVQVCVATRGQSYTVQVCVATHGFGRPLTVHIHRHNQVLLRLPHLPHLRSILLAPRCISHAPLFLGYPSGL